MYTVIRRKGEYCTPYTAVQNATLRIIRGEPEQTEKAEVAYIYSGAPPPLRPSQHGWIIEVSFFQGCRSLHSHSLPSTVHAHYDVI